MTKKTFKIIVIGNPGVGKTSLIRRFSKDKFTAQYSMTIGIEFESKEIVVDDQKVQLQIWDTVILQGRTGEVQIPYKVLLSQYHVCFAGVLDR